jgi:hypothetical protein
MRPLTDCKDDRGLIMRFHPAHLTLQKCLVPSVCLLLLSGLPLGYAQSEPDLLDQVRRREKVAADKLEMELRLALKEVQKFANSNPAKALDLLKQQLAQLEADTVLTPERRQALLRMLKDRIRVTELQMRENDPEGQGKGSVRRGNSIQDQVRSIEQLQRDGQQAQAKRQANELARRFPQSGTTQALDRVTTAAEQAETARRLNQQRERGLNGGLQDVDRSAIPPGRDLEFPKDWKERTKDRTSTVKLTEKEKAILQALNTRVTVNFKNSRLEDALEYLRTVTGQSIVLDPEAVKEVEASYDSPVTLSAKGVTIRTVLRKILNDLGLAYVIQNEVISVTSAQKAKESMVVRRYYVGDLLAGLNTIDTSRIPPLIQIRPPFAAAVVPQIQAGQLAQSVKDLVEMIETSVDPQSWRSNGGSGTIFFHGPSMSLIIKQSAEVHAQLGSGGLGK